MTRRYGLREVQWERIKDLLPGRKGQPGATTRDNRLFVQAVLYRYRAGIPWRDWPERLGDFRVIHLRHSRWSANGVWERVFNALAQAVIADKAYDAHERVIEPLRQDGTSFPRCRLLVCRHDLA